jgi:hypothetical protein
MLTAAAANYAVQPDTISSANKTVGRLYSALIGGSSPVPPQNLVLIPVSLLRQYQEMIQDLEERSKSDRKILEDLLRGREDMGEAESKPEQLSASATAVVNSLLASVPDASFFRDEVEEL